MKTKRKKESIVGDAAVPITGKQLNKDGEEVRLHNEPRMFSMEDAFFLDRSDESVETRELNVERGIRSVAFLLEYLAQDIEEVSAWEALGLAGCLNFCANQAAFAQRSRKIEEQFQLDIRDPKTAKRMKENLSLVR